MLENVIQNFFILSGAVYIFYKLLNINPEAKYLYSNIVSISLCISVISGLTFDSNQSSNWMLMLLLLTLTLCYISKINLRIVYTTVLFSFSFSFVAIIISGFIALIVLLPFLYNKYEFSWILVRLTFGIIHYILIYNCFHIPKLQKGMQFLYHIPSGNIGSTFCVFLIMLIIIFCEAKTDVQSLATIFYSLIIALGFLLLYWWNYHITQTYRKFLRKNEIDSLNLLLEERNQEILYLKSENDKLARIIHKDNKIIPALSMAIIDSYENKTALDLSTLEEDSSLHMKLKQLYDERVETLANYQQEILRLPQTDFDSVNAILSYMQAESLKQNIPFQLMLFDTLDSTIPAEITENDFTHILSDLLSNAIHACKDIPSSSIQIYLGKMDGISTIKILNTGTVFDIETLKNLGLARHTTHADTGGSGIGLMDIWKLKEQYKATLLIDEIIDNSNTYTCINILFNHKKHFIIQSNRHKELSAHINRPDLMIISKD